MVCARSVLAIMWEHRFDGIIYGGLDLVKGGRSRLAAGLATTIKLEQGAPLDLENINDATNGRKPGRDLYGVLVTYCGGAVMHKVRKLGANVASVHEAEGIGSQKGSEFAIHASEIALGLDDPPAGPILVGTDNFSNALVASTWGSASRSRHFYRRYYALIQHVKDGDVIIGYVADAHNPADFLTKWVKKDKLNLSIAYLTNFKAVPRGHPTKQPGLRPTNTTKGGGKHDHSNETDQSIADYERAIMAALRGG